MPWARFDDDYPNHRKIRPLSDAAFRLHTSAICWCNKNLTDGIITPADLPYVSDVKNPAKAVPQLVAQKLWEPTGNGWIVHDYHQFNPTAEYVLAERQKKSAAGKKGAHVRWHAA